MHYRDPAPRQQRELFVDERATGSPGESIFACKIGNLYFAQGLANLFGRLVAHLFKLATEKTARLMPAAGGMAPNRTVHRFQDLQNCDLGGRTGQTIAAV